MNCRALILALSLWPAILWSGTIDFASGPGLGSNTLTGVNAAVTPHAAWGSLPDAVWIGFADGEVPGYPVPTYLFTVFHPVYLPGAPTGSGSLAIGADDTVEVIFNGVVLFPATMVFDFNACVAGPIGCEPHEFGDLEIPVAILNQGANLLELRVYQYVGPTGVIYSGSIPYDTPEPATLWTGAFALAAIFLLRKGKPTEGK